MAVTKGGRHWGAVKTTSPQEGVNHGSPAQPRKAQHGPDHLDRMGADGLASARLASHLGDDAAAELLPQLRGLEGDFYASNAWHAAPGLAAMGRLAADDFRRLHPEISDDAIEALTWCYTYDYK